MIFDNILFELGLILAGSAVLATVFLFGRQPIILAYIAAGIAAGPHGFALIERADHIESIAHVGVVLLLFLLGVHLQPAKLLQLFRRTALLTLGTSLVFGAAAFGLVLLLGFGVGDAAVAGAAMMFSSTVVGLKLIPPPELHEQHAGELMTSVLLIQDILAIVVLLFLTGESSPRVLPTFALLTGKLLLLTVVAFLAMRFLMMPLLRRFGGVSEYLFVMTLGWCLLWSDAAHGLGLSHEMGAFVAGISIASCHHAHAVAWRLDPLREFFLILFFFAIGAEFDPNLGPRVLLGGLALGGAMLVLKPPAFRLGFRWSGEPVPLARELGARLGQASEFSILVAFAALGAGVLSKEGAMVIQTATIATFVVSTYWVVLKYPTPISPGKPAPARADAPASDPVEPPG